MISLSPGHPHQQLIDKHLAKAGVKVQTGPSSICPADFSLKTERLGPLPLVNHFIERMGLAALLEKYVPTTDPRCRVSHAKALGVLLRSIVVEREPIYRAQETVHGFATGLFGVAGGNLTSKP